MKNRKIAISQRRSSTNSQPVSPDSGGIAAQPTKSHPIAGLVTRHQNNKRHVLVVFVDFEKAFDIVWTAGLMIKLKRLGIKCSVGSLVSTIVAAYKYESGVSVCSMYTLENGTPH